MLNRPANLPVFLLAFANDRDDYDQYLRNLPDELREIKAALDQAKSQSLCDYVILPNATLSEILDTFTKPEYRNRIAAFHYAGHANDFQLLLETEDGRVATADAAGLAAFLSTQLGLQLVFLNGCSTEGQVDALLDANISMVIATSQAIEDDVAKEFAKRFYWGLAGGINVRAAYKEAEGAARAVGNGNLYLAGAQTALDKIQGERWPWELYVKKGVETAGEWNLPEAAGNPLFGIPKVPYRDLPAEPFRNLSWFTRQDAEVFFGRNYEIRQLYDRITEPVAAPIVLLYGQAGVGKSSLLDAGITPRLENSHHIIYLRRNQQLGLLGTAAQAFNFTADRPSCLGPAWQALEKQFDKPVLFIMDQLEELFTRPNGDPAVELKSFLDALVETFAIPAARPQGKLILGFRKEWESEIEEKLKDARLPHAKVFLDPLDRRDIIQAVAGLASSPRLQQNYGILIDDGLAEIIADDLSSDPNSPIAPTLQILLSKMWAEAKKLDNAKPTFTLALYRKLQREGILLSDFIDQQLTQLQEGQREAINSGLVLDLLTYHTTPLGTAEQRNKVDVEEEYKHQLGVLSQLLEKLKELYLLADPPQDATQTAATRLAHDTLGPLIRAKFNNSVHVGQRARRILENRAVEWIGNKSGAPLDDRDLTAVETGLSGMRAVRPEERRLIDVSRQARNRRELWKRIRAVVAIVAVVLIVGSSVYAWWLSRKAEAARQQALSQQLAAQADSLRTGAARLLPLRVLLAIEALRRSESADSYVALREPVNLLPSLTVKDGGSNLQAPANNDESSLEEASNNSIRAVRFSPDGKLIGIAEGNVVRLWDFAANTEVGRFQMGQTNISIRFSPEGRYLVAGAGNVKPVRGEDASRELQSSRGAVTVWDCVERRVVGTREFPTAIREVGFLKDKLLTIVDLNTATTTSIDTRTDQISWQINPPANKRVLLRTALTSDGKYLALGSKPSIAVYDVSSGQLISSLKVDLGEDPKAFVSELRFSPDGNVLVTHVRGRSAQVWNWKDSRLLSSINVDDFFPSLRVQLSSDNKYIAALGDENELIIWDAATGKESIRRVEKSEEIQGRYYPRIGFSPDSQFIAVSTGDRTVGVFHLRQIKEGEREAKEVLRVVPGGNITDFSYSPDGKSLVTADEKGQTAVWSLTGPFESEKMSEISTMHYDPKKQYVIGQAEKHLSIVRLSDNHEMVRLAGKTAQIVISPTGDRFSFVRLPDEDEDEDIDEVKDVSIQVCEMASGGVLREIKVKWPQSILLAFSQDGNRLFVATDKEAVQELNIQSGEVKLRDDLPASNYLQFSRNGQILVTTPERGSDEADEKPYPLEIFDLEQKQKIGTIMSTAFIPEIVFSGNNNYLATNVNDSTVVIWNLETGRELRRFTIQSPSNLAFSKDNNYVASTSGSNAFIYDIRNSQLIVLSHESGTMKSVAFSNDSKSVVTSHGNAWIDDASLIEIWKLPSGEKTARISLDGGVSEAFFNINDERVVLPGERVYLSNMHQTRLLPWKSQDLIAEACKRVGRNLTRKEWAQYLKDEPYRATCVNLPPEPEL